MKTERRFEPMTERYKYDLGPCSPKLGYAQVDTTQDAPFYGTWVNPWKLCIVTFCEGDTTIQVAESEEEFVKELSSLIQWQKDGGYWKGIDPMDRKHLEERFIELGFSEYLH